MYKFSLLLLVFLLRNVDCSFNIFDSDSPPQLYSTNDTGIIPVNITNYQDYLFNKDKVTVFQFYNSWCGHCIKYAPRFKEFGKMIANWNEVVQVLALNCVDEANEEVCRNYSVVAYPTVRLFWTQVKTQDDTGEHIDNLQQTPEFARDYTVNFILKNLQTKSPPTSWPSLTKLNLSNQKELDQHLERTSLNAAANRATRPVVGIVEKNDSLVGQQIILELSKYKDKLEVLSLNIPSTNDLNFTVDTTTKTALVQFDSSANNSNTNFKYRILATLPLTETNQTAYYVNYINQNLFDNKLILNGTKNQTHTPNLKSDGSTTDTNQRANVQPEDVPLSIGDLYGSISYTLYHQIPLKKKLNGRQLNILKRFFDVIERYFPADDVKFTEFIKNLNQFLKSKEQELEINDYLAYLKKNDYDFKSKYQGWQTCRGSQPQYRGYTCSLWSLFHTLTLNEYQKEKDTQKWVNLHEVLFTMRDYIGNFFSCTNCAQHFTSMAANLENELKLPNSSVIWLWSAHNRVNKRLKGDLTEDPEHPKSVYPYQKDCPNCYQTNGTGDFNEHEVMKYLTNRYGNIKRSEPKVIEDVPQSDKLTFKSDPDSFKNNGRGFNYTDYTMMVGLYVLTTLIVLSVFFYLPMRIRRRAKFTNNKPSTKYLDV